MAVEVFLDKQLEKLKDDDIIVSRDWSHHQFIIRYDETYPEELKDYGITTEQWKQSIEGLNNLYDQADRQSFGNFVYGCLGCVTLWTTYNLCNPSKKAHDATKAYIERMNKRTYEQKGLRWMLPQRQGHLSIRIVKLSSEP